MTSEIHFLCGGRGDDKVSCFVGVGEEDFGEPPSPSIKPGPYNFKLLEVPSDCLCPVSLHVKNYVLIYPYSMNLIRYQDHSKNGSMLAFTSGTTDSESGYSSKFDTSPAHFTWGR